MILSKLFNYIVTLPKTLQKTVKMKKKLSICIRKPTRFETRKTHQIEREKNPKFQKWSCNQAFIFKTQVYQ